MELMINSPKYGKKIVLIDDEDYDKIKNYSWGLQYDGNAFYITHNRCNSDRTRTMLRIHRIITDCPEGMIVDHINGDTFDNRKENLRICTQSGNCMNRRKGTNKSSVYKGVTFLKSKNRWMAQIKTKGKRKPLGTYKTEDQAAIAYNIASLEMFGEFARPNVNIMMHKGL